MRLKKRTIIKLSSVLILIVTISIRAIIRPIYNTWNEVPWFMYLFFVLDLFCIAPFYLSYIEISMNVKKNILIIGSLITAGSVILVGVAMIAFSFIPALATVFPPIDSSIEEVERFLRESQMPQFGLSLLINGFIVVIITIIIWFLIHQIYISLTQKDESNRH